MAVLKFGKWQVFLHYGQPPIKSHLQAEVLNYSAYFCNADITHDPGTVGYGSPLHAITTSKVLITMCRWSTGMVRNSRRRDVVRTRSPRRVQAT